MGCLVTKWRIVIFLAIQLNAASIRSLEFGTRLNKPNKRWLLIGEDLKNAKSLDLEQRWKSLSNEKPSSISKNDTILKPPTNKIQDTLPKTTDKPDIRRYDLPKKSQNLLFQRIEPFWPFSNVSTIHLQSNDFFKNNNNLFFNNLPEKFKDTTFFFSQIGPNSFEYRAQFHHTKNDVSPPPKFLSPFVNEYPEFPKITFPPFPTFPEPRDVFRTNNPDPPIRSPFPLGPQTNSLDHEPFKDPFKNFDLVFNKIGGEYPKIFRFNEERINIQDFEKEKKRRVKLGLGRQILEDVRRNHLLILHGGIFTVKEPPLFNRKVVRKRRQRFRDLNRIINN